MKARFEKFESGLEIIGSTGVRPRDVAGKECEICHSRRERRVCVTPFRKIYIV